MPNSEYEILKLRLELDKIHADMAHLFQRRLQINLKIWELKKRNQLPLIDEKREREIIHHFDSIIVNVNEKIAIQNLFKSILAESKNFTEKEIK